MTTLDNPALACTNAKLPTNLTHYQQQQRQILSTTLLPTRKTEAWKYSAKRLGDISALKPANAVSGDIDSHYPFSGHTIVLANGMIASDLPEIAGVSFKPFSALSEAELEQMLQGSIAEAKDLPMASLNNAHFSDGLYISVAKNVCVDAALRIVIKHHGAGTSFPRIFVQLESQAELTLIEELQLSASAGDGNFCNQVSELCLEAGAQLRYMRMNLDHGTMKHVAATGVVLKRNARFESHCLALGSELGRHDLRVEMREPGAECDLNGVCVTQGNQLFDNHTSIEHIAANCQSNENYRCIADDTSQIIFNGRIHIHRDAQKTLGAMSNKNLLLSSKAEIDAKPELEIYADDVKCAHGTTIGQLDETEVYYLKTRGISDQQARQILTLGFVLELVRATPLPDIAQFWETRLTELLSFNG